MLAVEPERRAAPPDRLVTEEPLEIRVHGPGEAPAALAVTMRTPGNDFELAAGFCRTEGLSPAPTTSTRSRTASAANGEQEYNVVTRAAAAADRRPTITRAAGSSPTSACGICGKAALDELEVRCDAGRAPVRSSPRRSCVRCPTRLAEHQRLFGETGGLHAAARFATDGRSHRGARRRRPAQRARQARRCGACSNGRSRSRTRCCSCPGRLSFELVQKAAVAGIPVLCAVSAPSSLAVAAAERFGQTVVGFLRDDRFNVYTHPERIDIEA